jgi:hypothetical protein
MFFSRNSGARETKGYFAKFFTCFASVLGTAQCGTFCHTVESLQSHFILTMSHWSSGLPVCFLSQGTQVQIPRGVIMWNRDSPVSDVSLHWWPRCDWSSLWPCLRWASTWTITRPSWRQCDNPTWSHTAFLSRFHARCRSPFWLHNRWSRLLWGSSVESLQSHFILTMSHWSSGLLVCFPSQGTQVQIPRVVIMWNRDSPVSDVSLQYSSKIEELRLSSHHTTRFFDEMVDICFVE